MQKSSRTVHHGEHTHKGRLKGFLSHQWPGHSQFFHKLDQPCPYNISNSTKSQWGCLGSSGQQTRGHQKVAKIRGVLLKLERPFYF